MTRKVTRPESKAKTTSIFEALCDMTGKNLDAIVAVMELRILTGDDFDDDYDIEEDEAFFGNDAHAKDTIKQREAAIVGDPQDKKAKTSKAAKSSKKSSG